MAEPWRFGAGGAGLVWEQVFPGVVEQAGQVRAALRSVLTGCPVIDEAVLVASELSANAVAHSTSGGPGGKFTVRLRHVLGRFVWGEVEDEGSGWDGCLQDSARDTSGLFLVVELVSACGADRGTNGHRAVWFRIDYAAQAPSGRGRGAVGGGPPVPDLPGAGRLPVTAARMTADLGGGVRRGGGLGGLGRV